MPEQKPSLEDVRESLKIAYEIIAKLQGVAESTTELLGLIELGINNDAQLQLLTKEIIGTTLRDEANFRTSRRT